MVTDLFLDDEEQTEEFFDDYFSRHLQDLAIDYMQNFFAGKQLHCGGSISPNLFKSPSCVDLVLNTSIETGVPLAYEAMDKAELKGGIQIVLNVFNRCSQLGIPKCFRAGILLVYLQLCYGVDV